MPPSTTKSNDSKSGRGALFLFGIVLVVIQLLILFQLSRHTTIVAQSSKLQRISSLSSNNGISKKKQNVSTATATQSRRQRRKPETRIPDGTFNGIDIYYTPPSNKQHSTVHCVGENYQPNAYQYRSCHFLHFCFDLDKRDYVVFQSPDEVEWMTKYVDKDETIGTSSILSENITVALGGLNPKWMQQYFRKLEWFPEILPASSEEGYYELPSNYVWVPFHSFAGFNAGHIIWDDFLPIYTLLEMFGLLGEAGLQPLLTRYVLKVSVV